MQKSSSSSSKSSSRKSPILKPLPETSPKTRYDRERRAAINQVMSDTKLPDDVADIIIQGMLGEPLSHFRYGITLDDLNIQELALNPNVYPLIKVIIHKYGGINTTKLETNGFNETSYKHDDLIKFHRNLSKNEEQEVISYLLKIYKGNNSTISSILLDWKALCQNNSAKSLLKLKIEDEKKIPKEEYYFEPIHNRIDWSIFLSMILQNPKSTLSKFVSNFMETKRIEIENGNWNIPITYDLYLQYKILAEQMHKDMQQKRKDMLQKRKNINDVPATDKEFWEYLSSGDITASKIKLLRERIEYEKTQPVANRGINWEILCTNSSPEAVQLIKERITYEKQLTRNGVLYESKIDLAGLALNKEPEAILLLMQQLRIRYGTSQLGLLSNQGITGIQQIIDNLSKNPSIIVRYDKIMKAQDKARHPRYLRDVNEITRMFSNIPTGIREKLKLT
jgi:hypothetical protein